MDDAKHRLLFGDADLPAGFDPDREADREKLFADDGYGPDDLPGLNAVASEVASDEPPQVWATALRLLDLGLDREEVFAQIVFARKVADRTAETDKKPFDAEAYVRSLNWLPLPDDMVAEDALVDAVRAVPGAAVSEAARLALDDLGRDPDDDLAEAFMLEVVDVMLADEARCPLVELSDDRLAHIGDLVAGSIFTHRLTAEERRAGRLQTFDLVGINRLAPLRLGPVGDPDEPIAEVAIVSVDERAEQFSLKGPEGWLEAFGEGALVAVQVAEDGVVTLSVEDEPAPDEGLVRRLRTVYESQIEDADLPATLTEVVMGLLLDDPKTFASPRLPISELCAAAGLERRGSEVAHSPSYWANAERLRAIARTLSAFDDDGERNAVLRAIDAALEPNLAPGVLREILEGLTEPALAAFVADELTSARDALAIDAPAFAERLIRAARRPVHVAVASWLAAVAAERRGASAVAGAELVRAAVDADPTWPPAVDWAGWYAYDRGDAAEAVRWWRTLQEPPDLDMRVAELFTPGLRLEPGRNDPCWCGSGRKYKACHLGKPQLPALPDRLTWLWRKSLAYLERRGNEAGQDLLHHAHLLAGGDDEEGIEEALANPLVADVVLHERGWFERFLKERGPLLPDDEMVLATGWSTTPRSVFEVLSAEPGLTVTLKDRRSGTELVVPEERFDTAPRPGLLICARAVFDGEGHQLLGGLFTVPPGGESVVLELCDARAGEELCAFAANLP